MRIAVFDVSHWHAPLACAGLERADCEVVAVVAREREAAASWISRFGSRVYSKPVALLDAERVDFVFVFGAHSHLPATARLVLERGIACSIEKPGGTSAKDVAALAALQQQTGAFVSVPFVNRLNPFIRRLKSGMKSGEYSPLAHLSFVDLAGSPERYLRAGCNWMLTKAVAGGGCLINLGVHFIDLFAYLTGLSGQMAGVTLSDLVHGKDVEDHARILLSNSEGATCLVEVGYVYPDDAARFQAYHFVGRDWFAEAREDVCRLVRGGTSELVTAPIDAGPLYADYVLATLRAFEAGEPPVADLQDLHRVMTVVDAAYSHAGRGSGEGPL